MRFSVVTLFPEMFTAITDHGISGRAVKTGLVSLNYFNPRDYTSDRHRTVDDKPFGGGPGMLMKTEPLARAIVAARDSSVATDGDAGHTVYLSPQGRRLDQAAIQDMALRPGLVLVCGRYQGIDARVLETEVDAEWSLGDFILSGGELAAMALIDALIRLQPGALGDEDSARQDSFSAGLLHCPQYTRPRSYAGHEVPPALLSGDHSAIARWQRQQSLGITWLKRPDLLAAVALSKEDQELLTQFQQDYRAALDE